MRWVLLTFLANRWEYEIRGCVPASGDRGPNGPSYNSSSRMEGLLRNDRRSNDARPAFWFRLARFSALRGACLNGRGGGALRHRGQMAFFAPHRSRPGDSTSPCHRRVPEGNDPPPGSAEFGFLSSSISLHSLSQIAPFIAEDPGPLHPVSDAIFAVQSSDRSGSPPALFFRERLVASAPPTRGCKQYILSRPVPFIIHGYGSDLYPRPHGTTCALADPLFDGPILVAPS